MNNTERDRYRHPLCTRYASAEMQAIFSERSKFTTWRSLWIELAKAEQALGLEISSAQIADLKAYAEDINWDIAEAREAQIRHDVMAHIHAYGEQCPEAKGIIHLGATSCYVGDNTNLILMRQALTLLKRKLLSVIAQLADFAWRYRELPTLAYTHFQAAQPTTVGKRATLWLHDLLLDFEETNHLLGNLKLLGCKGATGTQASFWELFDGDYAKTKELEQRIAAAFGFSGVYPVSGQTYSRKVDDRFMHVLCGIAQSAHKFANDIRLLQHLKEVEEPFEREQVGSSAMPYKRNPMRCERITGLARYVISNSLNSAQTAAAQWLERTLDDSSNWRMALPETFLAVDAILEIMLNVSSGLVVYPQVCARHLEDELPFMATENILMAAVRRGGDRQVLHERVRNHAMEAGRIIKELGGTNDLLQRLAADSAFGLSAAELARLSEPAAFIGFAPQQTEEFIVQIVRPLLEANQEQLLQAGKLRV